MAKNCKPFLSFDEQISLLEKRNLKIQDKDKLIWYLKKFNYQRVINGYNDPFFKGQDRNNNLYKDNVDSQMIISFFNLDRSIGSVLNGTIHSIELYLNTVVCHEILKILNNQNKQNFDFDNLSFLKEKVFNIEDDKKLKKFLKGIIDIELNNENLFFNCNDFEEKKKIPLYKLCLKWDFGTTINVFVSLKEEIQKTIIQEYFEKVNFFSTKTFVFVIKSIKTLRNKISHNEVIYNLDLTNFFWKFFKGNTKEISSEINSVTNKKNSVFRFLLFDLLILIDQLKGLRKDDFLNIVIQRYLVLFLETLDNASAKYIVLKMDFVDN